MKTLLDRIKELEAERLDTWLKINYELAVHSAKEQYQDYQSYMIQTYQDERLKVYNHYAAGIINEDQLTMMLNDLKEMYNIKEARDANTK